MKKRITHILAALTLGLVYGVGAYADCPPTWAVIREVIYGCPYPDKSVTWRISWQDGNTAQMSNYGNGKCYSGWLSTTICAPVFNEPRTFPYYSRGQERVEWAQTAYHRKYDGGCTNDGFNTVRVSHSCAPYGGGLCGAYATAALSSPELPEPTLVDSSCCYNGEAGQCTLNGGEWDEVSCTCISPVVIDVDGNGFNLTNAEGGVLFDILGDGKQKHISWTAAGSDDAWLALDRNGNGTIDDGKELFGSSTPQPYLLSGESKNGFRALAMFDRAERGGNSDGQIDNRDTIFPQLRLWQDRDHNGVSEPHELRGLPELNVSAIELQYHESRRHDRNDNWFGYRAKVQDARGARVGRWAWDVYLRVAR